ncbi:RNA polymerase sigma factor [Streptomyces lavendulae]|uniref:RNA polymerase sigma factor n=1 Tax=Streptomyces lavendulae TaxID=1914 RepID=UPI0037F7582B
MDVLYQHTHRPQKHPQEIARAGHEERSAPGGPDPTLQSLLSDLGPAYRRLSSWGDAEEILAQYASPMITTWIASGVIFSKVYRLTGLRMHVTAEMPGDTDTAGELAGITVAVALRTFREKLIQGKGWDPERGTRARTFFVGQCLLCFPDEYRRWNRDSRMGAVLPLPDLDDARARQINDPVFLTEIRSDADELLKRADTRTRSVLIAVAYGLSHPEIADQLGLTPKAVEMLLYRFRKSVLRAPGTRLNLIA